MITELQALLKARGSLTLQIKAKVGAPSSLILGTAPIQPQMFGAVPDGSLKVAIAAIPEGGKANAELKRLLADTFNVHPTNVEILLGHTSSLKTVRITGGIVDESL